VNLTDAQLEELELQRTLARMRRKTLGQRRYAKRYARHVPPRQGRGRSGVIYTMFPYGAPFDIARLAEDVWGLQLKLKPVRLGR
jgi:hypothetical protein